MYTLNFRLHRFVQVRLTSITQSLRDAFTTYAEEETHHCSSYVSLLLYNVHYALLEKVTLQVDRRHF
jgi:hypothetical protein